MLEHRQDPLTGRFVSIAAARGQRPDDFAAGDEPIATPASARICPFCEGHEGETPHEVFALRGAPSSADAPGWQVRVITNKYPAFRPDAPAVPDGDELHRCAPAAGLHEVIVESPQHLTSVTQLSVEQLALVLQVYRRRLRDIAAEGRWSFAFLFKNSGPAAGASQAHLHSQLIALPEIPPAIAWQHDRAQAYFAQHGRTLQSAIIERQRTDGRRMVIDTGELVAFCPYASFAPYEIHIAPAAARAHFAAVNDDELAALANVLHDLVGRLGRLLPGLSYNWLLHTAPLDRDAGEHHHWRIEIIPRLTRTAAYEWSTASAINAIAPEQAAAALRSNRV